MKRAYRIFGQPATFFTDRQRIIRDIVIGPLIWERASTALTTPVYEMIPSEGRLLELGAVGLSRLRSG